MSLDKSKMSKFDASVFRIAIVASKFNLKLVDALVKDAKITMKKAGVSDEDIFIVRVPGSAEIPLACSILSESGAYDAIIALGVVIAGETPHHEIIGHSTANALQSISIKKSIPIINGIIVANTKAQAEERTIGNIKRGIEFAEAGLEMAWQLENLFKNCSFDLDFDMEEKEYE